VRLQFEDGPRKQCLAATDQFAVPKPGTVAAMFGAKGFEFNMPSYLSTYTVTAKEGKTDSSMKTTEYPGGIPAKFFTYTGEEMPDGPVGSCPLKISTITSNQDKNIPQPGEMELLAQKIDGLESDLVMTCEQEAYYNFGLTGETTDSKKSLAWFIADSVTGKAKGYSAPAVAEKRVDGKIKGFFASPASNAQVRAHLVVTGKGGWEAQAYPSDKLLSGTHKVTGGDKFHGKKCLRFDCVGAKAMVYNLVKLSKEGCEDVVVKMGCRHSTTKPDKELARETAAVDYLLADGGAPGAEIPDANIRILTGDSNLRPDKELVTTFVNEFVEGHPVTPSGPAWDKFKTWYDAVYARAKKADTVAYGHGGMQAATIDRVGIKVSEPKKQDGSPKEGWVVAAGPVILKDEILSMQGILADSDHLSVMVTHGLQISKKHRTLTRRNGGLTAHDDEA